jgi:P27 family predicted phage terminase small subunit
MGKRGYLAAGVQLQPADAGGRLPGPPAHLSAEADRFWRKTAKLLRPSGRLCTADLAAFERLCVCWSSLQTLDGILQREGWLVATAAGTSKPHPAVTMRQGEMKVFLSLCQAFGLTPAARLRTPVEDSASADGGIVDKYLRPPVEGCNRFEGRSE